MNNKLEKLENNYFDNISEIINGKLEVINSRLSKLENSN